MTQTTPQQSEPNAAIELLPCPFCGSGALHYSRANIPVGFAQHEVDHWINCIADNCGAHMGMCESKDAATMLWNTRPTLAPDDCETPNPPPLSTEPVVETRLSPEPVDTSGYAEQADYCGAVEVNPDDFDPAKDDVVEALREAQEFILERNWRANPSGRRALLATIDAALASNEQPEGDR